MAAAAVVELPNSNRVVPGSHHLPLVTYPKVADPLAAVDAEEVAASWVSSFNELVQKGGFNVSGLFLEEGYWRDLLCLSWDFHNLQGPEKITSFVRDRAKGWRIKRLEIDRSSDVRKPTVAPVDFGGNFKGVQSFLTVETDVGKGRGLVRLFQAGSTFKVFTLFTTLHELTGFEESVNQRRPTGVEHGAQPGRKNWKDRRISEENFEGDLEPAVLIIGNLKSCPDGKVLKAETGQI